VRRTDHRCRPVQRGALWNVSEGRYDAWNTKPLVTADGPIANGEAGLFKLGCDKEHRWWGETETDANRAAVAGDDVVTLDKYHRLRAFDRNSGDRAAETTLPSEGVPLAPAESVGRTLLVTVKPLIAYGTR
jgi:hypothetical protein